MSDTIHSCQVGACDQSCAPACLTEEQSKEIERRRKNTEYKRIWRSKNKEKVRETNRRFMDKDRASWNARTREYRKNNTEKLRAQDAARFPDKYKRMKSDESKWREISAKRTEYMRIWRDRNREKLRLYAKQRSKIENNAWHIRLHNRIKQALFKCKLARKSSKTIDLIGCSVESLRDYIQSKFTEGMTWDNYGHGKDKWCIDHIIPCSSFDLTDPENQKKCFHFSNLQPLWFVENCRKSDSVPAI